MGGSPGYTPGCTWAIPLVSPSALQGIPQSIPLGTCRGTSGYISGYPPGCPEGIPGVSTASGLAYATLPYVKQGLPAYSARCLRICSAAGTQPYATILRNAAAMRSSLGCTQSDTPRGTQGVPRGYRGVLAEGIDTLEGTQGVPRWAPGGTPGVSRGYPGGTLGGHEYLRVPQGYPRGCPGGTTARQQSHTQRLIEIGVRRVPNVSSSQS
jgi:hypothetical protein